MMKLIMLIHLSVYIIFWMHTVGTAHGNTVWPPWITLSGCFNYSSNNATSNFEKNEPTKCFERCQGNQSVGLKNMSCICNPIYTSSDTRLNIYCNVSCPGKPGIYCGREGAGNELMSVYTRDAPLPDGINKSTNYGYGYVVISGGYKIFHTSDANTSFQIDKLCYDEFEPLGQSQCKPDKSTLSSWEGAIQACNHGSARLINASDVSTCGTGITFIGTYWIWLYREKPDTTTSTATTLTATTTTSTSSTSSKPTPSFKTTTDSRSNHTSDNPVIEQTSKASSSDGINVVAVLVSVIIPIVLTAITVFGIIVYKKKTMRVKHDDNRDENGVCANLENGEYGVRPGPSHLENEDGIENECQVEKSGSYTERKARKEGHRSKRDEKKRRKENNHKDKINKGLVNAFSDKGICPKRDIATASGVRVNFDLPPGERTDTRKVKGQFDLPSGKHHDTGEQKKKHKRKKKKTTNMGDRYETNYLNLENDVVAH